MKTIEQKAREYAIGKSCTQYHCTKRHYITCEKHGEGCDKAMEYYESFLAGAKAATEWISIEDELPKNEELILAKEPDSRIELIQGWQLKDSIKPFAADDFYTHWQPIELPSKK